MTRTLSDWHEELVKDVPVAEHRYTWGRDEGDPPITRKAVRDAAPYHKGDVIYIIAFGKVRKARVHVVLTEDDACGFPRELYRVQYETAKGIWSRQFLDIPPGVVQRAYHAAGLAPDLEGKIDA